MRRLLPALAGLVLLAPPAQAAPRWHDGEIESSTVTNCNFFPEKGINNLAQFQADPAALPKVGDTFYVRMLPARTGNGCGIGMHIHPEIVLPVGVEVAISGATPVRCLSWDYLADVATPLDGCPQTPQAGAYGPSFDQETPSGPKPWEVAHLRGVVIEIPLRSSRPLKGAAGRPSSCVRVAGRPCPAAQTGDNAQLGVWVSDGRLDPWLVPSVPLFVEPAGGTPPPPAPPVIVDPTDPPVVTPAINRAPSKARLRRTFAVRVFVAARGSTISATLVLKGRTVARRTVRDAPAGLSTVKLKATGRRTGRAELRVSVRAPDGSVVRGTKRITLRR
jgi:hypothetical protein